MPTLSEVAARAGVSVSVASRVLTGDPSLRTRPETRDRVLQVAKDLNYNANYAGRALRLARSKALALIVPDVSTPLFADLLAGASDASGEEDYTLLLGRSDRVIEGGDLLRRLVGEGRVDGFVLQRTDDLTDQALEHLVANDARIVLVASRTPRRRGSVILDDVAGARLATEHLLGLGHRRIGLIGGVEDSDIARRREQGYAAALRDAGLRKRDTWIRRLGYAPDVAAGAARSIMEEPKAPTALVVANVNGAIGALTALRQAGRDVPGEVSVVAIHDQWMAANTWPPLTTVKMPYYEVGYRAVRLLIDRLGGAPPEDIVVSDPPPLLVLRESTAAPAQGDGF